MNPYKCLSIYLPVAIALLPIYAPVAEADFFFGEPVNLESVLPFLNAADESIDSLSYDGLEMYILSFRSGGHGGIDIWVLRRNSIEDDWSAPENLGSAVNSAGMEQGASISADGLTLLFQSVRADGYGGEDMYMATRSSTTAPWGQAVNMGPGLNSSSHDNYPCMSPDGLELYFSSMRPGGFGLADLWVATRATPHDAWGQPENLGPVINSTHADMDPKLSPDGRILFFSGHALDDAFRPGGYGGADIWMTRRETLSAPWQVPVNLGPQVNDSKHGGLQRISPDGSTLYFSTVSGGVWENWVASILPVVDFTGDAVVDSDDMSIMMYHWGQDEPLCDIAPMPWGDGTVDMEDLIVLAEHLEPGLEAVAHWRLDESTGAVACDSMGSSDATVVGGATWRPEDGLIDGALELDGVDDHVITDFISDPKAGPVRVVCWVKTEVAGGVIVSQEPGAAFGSTWLATDLADGTLLSEMMFPLPSLHSTVVVADGQWHEVAAEWDGTYRRLWADKQAVARDTQPVVLPPLSWNGTLTIGASLNPGPGTCFSGLIDDVRIYNRAVRP